MILFQIALLISISITVLAVLPGKNGNVITHLVLWSWFMTAVLWGLHI